MEALKNCPFCGGKAIMSIIPSGTKTTRDKKKIPKEAVMVEEIEFRSRFIWKYRTTSFCPQCANPSCMGRIRKKFFSEYMAIKAWNERSDSQ